MRRLTTVAAALALTGAGLVSTACSASGQADKADAVTSTATAMAGKAATGTACSTVWGSGAKSATESEPGPLKNVRTSRHACYDRMVFDIDGTARRTGYHVGYVDTFHQDGSGERIPVSGGAVLQVYVSAPSYDPATLEPTYLGKAGKRLPGVNVTGYRTFKDTRFGASSEGQTQVALGVRAKLPFRVLRSADHLIVDVAHRW
ncbi:AMIN-like domain-containing (lipo)protein [Streptomyces sp. NPDC002867]